MPTQSQKNSLDIIKLQGETKLINQKIDTITHNHLAHLEKKVDNVYKLLWLLVTLSLSSLLNFMFNLLN